MFPRRKKNKLTFGILFLLGALAVAWICLVASYGAKEGYVLVDWILRMQQVVLPQLQQQQNLFQVVVTVLHWWNPFSVLFLLTGEIIYIFAILLHQLNQKNYITGKEFGTVKFADPKLVHKKLCDKKKNKIYHGVITKTILIALVFRLHRNVKVTINMNERRLSQNISMSMDTRQTGLNDNVLIIGGSGSGKTFYFAKPNLMSMTGSYICTDPKGELLRDTGGILKKRGYEIKVLNLLNEEEMKKSTRYNPLKYIRTETDVIKLCTNIIQNTAAKDSKGGDPFFDRDGPNMLLQALIFYVLEVYKEKPEKQNFRTVMELLSKAEFRTDEMGQKINSTIDDLFYELEAKEELRMEQERRAGKIPGKMSSAVLAYNGIMRGAGDTVRSILITTNAKLANLKSDAILDLLSEDEINIPELGAGKNHDKKTKTALYCVIPDTDKSYNFVVGMLYTQIFQELYYQADFVYDGRLPIHVTCMFDEFANVALPEDFTSIESTMRSREISACIIIQNIAQLKELFKDSWETVPGNCDTLIYLGGNEQGSHKYVSELIGKGTFDKKTEGETKGKQGSSSNNYDRLGRELLMPEEVRKLPNSHCVLMIRGEDPILDRKIRTQKHPFFREMQIPFVFDARLERRKKGCFFLGQDSFKAIQKQDELKKEKSYVTIDGEQLLLMPSENITEFFAAEARPDDKTMDVFLDELSENRKVRMAKQKEKEERDKEELTKEELEKLSKVKDGIANVLKLRTAGYSKGQIKTLLPLLLKGYSYDDIASIFTVDMKKSEIELYKTYLVQTKK